MPPPPSDFEAWLEPGDRALGWTIARLPFDPAARWPHLVRLRVCGTIAGRGTSPFAFRTSLFAYAGGGFYLLVNRAMQQAAQVATGDRASFTLEPDLAERPANLPDALAVLLEQEPGLADFYRTLSEYTRREIGKWIDGVKSDAARLRRAEQTAERLLATMEAERELPPLFETAFRRRPAARRGWQQASATHRRAELMAVFFYQSPEARAKRLEKLLDKYEARASPPADLR